MKKKQPYSITTAKQKKVFELTYENLYARAPSNLADSMSYQSNKLKRSKYHVHRSLPHHWLIKIETRSHKINACWIKFLT